MGQTRYRPKHGTLGTDEVEELQADAAILSIGLAYQVNGAKELLEEIITQRIEGYKHKREMTEAQRKQDIEILQRAVMKPTHLQVAQAKARQGAEF